MKTLTFHKAGQVDTDPVESVILVFDKDIDKRPPFADGSKGIEWVQEADLFYSKEAVAIARALYETLPMATMDRLIFQLLSQKLSYYKYSMRYAVEGKNKK